MVAACGSDSTSTLETLAPSGAAEFTTTPATTTTGTTSATATTAPAITTGTTIATTTIATTTVAVVPSTSVLAVVPTGWSAVDWESVPSKAFPPCCGDTWHGDVSPVLTPAGQPLADGPYAVTMQWPDDPTQPLQLEVLRFEQCALLPQSSCESRSEGYGPDELGIDASASRLLTVELDDRLRVVVVGWDGARLDNDRFVIEQANGTALAALATAVDQAHGDVFADRFVAGEDPDAIVADVLANPTGGFTNAVGTNTAFRFTPESGPPLLVQAVFPYVNGQRVAGRGTDALAVRSIEIVGGQITLYVYAAYVP